MANIFANYKPPAEPTNNDDVDLFTNYTTFSAIVPRLINPSDESIINIARFFNFIIAIIVFGGVLISFYLKIGTEKFLYVLNEMQLIFHLPLMHLMVPGNVLIVFTYLINLVKFDVINQLRLVDFSKSINDAQKTHEEFSNGYWFELGYKSYNLYANMGFLFYMFVIWAVVKLIHRFVLTFIMSKFPRSKNKIKLIKRRTDCDGRILFIQSYLIIVLASLILLIAPIESIDRTPVNITIAVLILIASLVYPAYMVRQFKLKGEPDFAKQRIRLLLYFLKRVCFVLVCFLIPDGALQVMFMSFAYLASLIVFSIKMPLNSSRSNFLGMVNEFLLLSIIDHSLFFPGLQGEKTKYEIGKSMLTLITIFIVLNIYYFLHKSLPHARFWLLKTMSPEMRQDLAVCLGYLRLRWLCFPHIKTKAQRDKERQERIEAFLKTPAPKVKKPRKPCKEIIRDLVAKTKGCGSRLWKWLLKRVRNDVSFTKRDKSTMSLEKSL